jgi:DNA-binding transcriptional MerR regulator
MQKSVFTTVEVASITGFSLRQLDYWARKKIIIPGFAQAHGSGSRRLYKIEDIVQLNIIHQLKKQGWSTQKIAQSIETLKDMMNDTNPLRNAILFNSKGTIFALSKTREGERILIDALSTTRQQVTSFVFEILLEQAKGFNLASDMDNPTYGNGVSVGFAQTGGNETCY